MLLLLTDGEIRRPPDSTAEEATYHMTVKRLGIGAEWVISLGTNGPYGKGHSSLVEGDGQRYPN